MEVLTEVDEQRIPALLEREKFFWLDLHGPSADAFERVGEHARAAPDGDGGHARVRPAAEGRHLRVATSSSSSTPPGEPAATSRSPAARGPRYVSGDYIVTVRQEACDLLDDLHDALMPEGTEAEDYLVYRIFDSLTDAWYPVITRSRSSRPARGQGVRAR